MTIYVKSQITEVAVDRETLVGSIVQKYYLKAGSGVIENTIATIGGNESVLLCLFLYR